MRWGLALALGCTGDVASSPVERSFNHDQNGLWARRVWLHEARTDAELDALVATLRARGITQLYPFLGPPDAQGAPGWREGEVQHPVDEPTAASFLTRMRDPADTDGRWSEPVRLDAVELADCPEHTPKGSATEPALSGSTIRHPGLVRLRDCGLYGFFEQLQHVYAPTVLG